MRALLSLLAAVVALTTAAAAASADLPSYAPDHEPRWSGDGRWLSVCRRSFACATIVVRSDGSERHGLGPLGRRFAWSPRDDRFLSEVGDSILVGRAGDPRAARVVASGRDAACARGRRARRSWLCTAATGS